jgi:type II secretory pathway component PulJ
VRRGTTLLETLVALGITALVLAALQGVVVRARAARTAATASADRLAAARTVLLRLAAELEAAAAPAPLATAEGVVVRSPALARTPWSTLRLVAVARDAAPEGVPASDRRLVEWDVVPDDATGHGTLVRRESARPEPPGVERPAVPVLSGVRQFAVRCFDGSAWTPTWGPGPLPAAVEVVLGVDDGAGGTDELRTTVRLPVGTG